MHRATVHAAAIRNCARTIQTYDPCTHVRRSQSGLGDGHPVQVLHRHTRPLPGLVGHGLECQSSCMYPLRMDRPQCIAHDVGCFEQKCPGDTHLQGFSTVYGPLSSPVHKNNQLDATVALKRGRLHKVCVRFCFFAAIGAGVFVLIVNVIGQDRNESVSAVGGGRIVRKSSWIRITRRLSV